MRWRQSSSCSLLLRYCNRLKIDLTYLTVLPLKAGVCIPSLWIRADPWLCDKSVDCVLRQMWSETRFLKGLAAFAWIFEVLSCHIRNSTTLRMLALDEAQATWRGHVEKEVSSEASSFWVVLVESSDIKEQRWSIHPSCALSEFLIHKNPWS